MSPSFRIAAIETKRTSWIGPIRGQTTLWYGRLLLRSRYHNALQLLIKVSWIASGLQFVRASPETTNRSHLSETRAYFARNPHCAYPALDWDSVKLWSISYPTRSNVNARKTKCRGLRVPKKVQISLRRKLSKGVSRKLQIVLNEDILDKTKIDGCILSYAHQCPHIKCG